jgi:hypothetical protein
MHLYCIAEEEILKTLNFNEDFFCNEEEDIIDVKMFFPRFI